MLQGQIHGDRRFVVFDRVYHVVMLPAGLFDQLAFIRVAGTVEGLA